MSQVYGPGLLLPPTKYNEDESPVPALGSLDSDEARPGTTSFIVRDGVSFHDGSELSPEHIRVTFDRYRQLARDADPYIDPAFAYIDSIGIDSDQDRLSLLMPGWMKTQPYRLATVAPLSPALPELGHLSVEEEPLGLGGYTYRFDTEPAGEGGARRGVIHLSAFEGYFEGSPEIKHVAVHLYPNDRELIRAFITGEIHVARLPTFHAWQSLEAQLPGSPQSDNALPKNYPRPNHFFFLAFNNARSPFDMEGVRPTLARAINRKAMLDEPEAWSVITDFPIHPRSSLGESPRVRRSPTRYMPTTARRMLQEADLIRQGQAIGRTGQQIRLNLIYPDHVELYEEMALRVKNDLQRLGFRIDAEPVPPEVVRKRLQEGDYWLALSEMTLPPTPEAIQRIFHSTNASSGLNFTRYRNLTFDTNIDAMIFQRAPNPETNRDAAIRLLGDEFPLLPLFFQANEYYVFNISVLDPESLGYIGTRLEPIAKWGWR